MDESYREILTLSLFALVSVVYADSDCPVLCECVVDDGNFNLSCAKKIPDTLPLNTRVVNITDIEYKYLHQYHFNHTRWANVTQLYLHSKSVLGVNGTVFWNVRNLMHLQISFPALEYISNNAMSHLLKVQTLDLSGNYHLSFNMVANALGVTEFTNNLDELNLQSLAWAVTSGELDQTFFLTLQRFNIKRLDLSHAHFTKVDPIALSQLGPSLKELLMVDADFTSYSFFSFGEAFKEQMFPKLQLSDMSFAKIPQIILYYNNEHDVAVYDCFFPPFQAHILKMNNVLSRKVAQQNITYKSRNCNRDLRGRIEIKNNNIRLLNISFDPHMPMYREVDLSNNGLEYLSINVTSHLTILKWISLTQNNLGAMENFAEFVDLFARNLELTYIDLSFNKLNRLPRDFFRNNRKLKTIILNNNLLNSQLFRIEHLTELENVDISNNKILFLHSDLLRTFDIMSFEMESNHSYVRQFSINLTGNTFMCECDTKSFIQWILTTKVILVNREKYTCELEKNVIQLSENTLRDIKQLCERTKVILMATLIPLFSAGILVIIGIMLICTYRRYLKLRHIKFLIEKYRKDGLPKKHLLFLSFCNEDRDFVYRYIIDGLKDALSERLGAPKDDWVCIGDVHFEPGRYILEEIIRCTESCSVVLLVVSEAFCRSYYCDFEALVAELEKKPIILMFLEEVDPKCMSKIMYKHFQRYTRVKWTRKGDEFELVPCWAKICDSIYTFAGEKARFAYKCSTLGSTPLPTT